MPRNCGRLVGSYQRGEPQVLQKVLNPFPALYRFIFVFDWQITRLGVSIKPHAECEAPENFRQFVQWQNLT